MKKVLFLAAVLGLCWAIANSSLLAHAGLPQIFTSFADAIHAFVMDVKMKAAVVRATRLAPPREPPTASFSSFSSMDAGPANAVKSCHPSYSGCLDPNASDYDCEGGAGNGPYYTGFVRVTGPDVFELDGDGDGRACE